MERHDCKPAVLVGKKTLQPKVEGAMKYRGRNHHHLRPKSRKGSNHKSNLLLIDARVHTFWHQAFGNRTLPEVIRLLQRVERAKGGQR